MAKLIYHSDRGEKSALCLVKANAFQMSSSPVYVPRAAVAGLTKGQSIDIPDGYKLKPIVDQETGEVRTAKNGAPLHTLVWGEA